MKAIKEALIQSSKALPGGEKNVIVMPANPEWPLEETNGIAAFTVSKNFILLQVQPSVTKNI
ncbi:hypothetical protein V1498_11715 [Peribacillus sp. SCS-26]|uniref:hypothetical protein n=1 Tax=Paraperibacillus marinus TaxID=3115295 RepID=UPI003905D959